MSIIIQNEIDDTTVPVPATGKIALFIDEDDSKLKGKKPDGSVVFIGTTPVHADTHHTGGTDALAPADIGAAPSVHNHDGTDITTGTVAASRLPNTSSTTAGIVPTTSGSATGDKLRVQADGTSGWDTPALDDEKVSKLYESDGGAAAVEVDAAGDVTCNGALLISDNTYVEGQKLFVGSPSADYSKDWNSLFQVIELGKGSSILGRTDLNYRQLNMIANAYYTSDSQWKAYEDGVVARMRLGGGDTTVTGLEISTETDLTAGDAFSWQLQFRVAHNRIGFFGSNGSSKPSVTGSRSGNAALASLLTALDTLGLIDDNTTA